MKLYIEAKNNDYAKDSMAMAIIIYTIMFREQLYLIICS
jgi:hypothetical protein